MHRTHSRLLTVALSAIVSLGGAATAASAAPDLTAPNPAVAAPTAQRGPIAVVNQMQTGLPTAPADCGPSATVAALLRFGITPHRWNEGPAAAVAQARADSGPGDGFWYLNHLEIQTILNSPDYDVTYHTVVGTDVAKQRIKEASTDPSVILGTLPNGVAHWVALVGYENGAYEIADSSDGQIKRWSDADLDWFANPNRLNQPQFTITFTNDPR